jgi:hypothetical protein
MALESDMREPWLQSRSLLWVEEWGWDEFGVSVSYSDAPSCSVDYLVMGFAEHGAVVEGCVAAIAPFCAVVDVAAGWWLSASWVGAASVSDGHGAADGGGDGAGGSSDVEYFGVAAHDQRDDVGVAGEHA